MFFIHLKEKKKKSCFHCFPLSSSGALRAVCVSHPYFVGLAFIDSVFHSQRFIVPVKKQSGYASEVEM